MDLLVAGNLGFIGAHLERGLTRAGHRVAGADQGEVAQRLAAAKPEAVVWAAGSRGQDPEELEEQHVAAPLRALTAARPRRFVYLSTGEIYGPQAVPFSEQATPEPQSAYARAKLRAEACLSRAAAGQGTALTILRLSLVYGPGQQGAMFIPSLVDHLRRGAVFPMTPGEQTRDFVYIDDVVAAVALSLDPAAPDGVYNIGSGQETRLLDLARIVAARISSDAAQLLAVGALSYRPAEQMRYALDVCRAREALGFRARVSLEQGLSRCVAAVRPE